MLDDSFILLLDCFFANNKNLENQIVEPEELERLLREYRQTAKQLFALMHRSITEETWKRVCEEVRSRVSVTYSFGTTLTDDSSEPWVQELWNQEGSQYYWERYKNYLLADKHWPKRVVRDINIVTDDILDQCGNPKMTEQPWQRRGLVIGDVQSGKTAVFTGLINKASDAGYKVIIVLTGILETLRQQTQSRLDEEYVGQSSRVDGIKQECQNCGVGRKQTRFPVSLTSVYSDFNTVSQKQLNFSLKSVNEPVLLVIKKNVSVLRTVIKWLKAKNLEGNFVDKPLLLIDDEADNASINTRKEDEEPTQVNKHIRSLLALFKNATYVGFTATPFANVFIDPDACDDYPDDLFPRNFIRTTNIPSTYFSVQKMLSETGADDELTGVTKNQCLACISDAEDFLPLNHKKNVTVPQLWPSLIRAIHQFLLINALMDLRELRGQAHRSMMVNVSRFTKVQNELSDVIADYIDDIKDEVAAYGASRFADSNPTIKALKEEFDHSFGTSEFSWAEIKKVLYQSIKHIKVFVVNNSSEAKQNRLDYSMNKTGLRAVIVGGLGIARGVTLEGLCVSYLYRSTAYYDTLMQMGRWFGYRPGYEDLCRIWLSDRTISYYRQISRATAELKQEIQMMKDSYRTPKDFGLKVRESPDSLLITSRNKMRSGKPIVVRTSFSSYFVESLQLQRNQRQENESTTVSFLEKVQQAGIPLEQDEFKKRRIFRGVPKEFIADFVEDFKVDPRCYQLASYADHENGLANFIRNNHIEKLQTWDVVVEARQNGNEEDAVFNLNGPVYPIRRRVSDMDAWKSGRVVFDKNRIAGSDSEAATLSPEIYQELAKKKAEYDSNYGLRLYLRSHRERPLLILMPVMLYQKTDEEDKAKLFTSELLLDSEPHIAYGLSFVNFDDLRNLPGMSDRTTYLVNKVWLKEHFNLADDEEDEE